jgi:hypothetical protein
MIKSTWLARSAAPNENRVTGRGLASLRGRAPESEKSSDEE